MKSKFWFIIILVFAVYFFGLVGNRVNIVDNIGDISREEYEKIIESQTDQDNNYGVLHCEYSELNSDEEDIYNQMCAMIDDGQVEFEFKNADKDTVISAYTAVFKDHPEYFWFGRGYTCKTTTYLYSNAITLKPMISASFHEVNSRKLKFENAVDNILNLCEELPTIYDKVVFVHDYIVDNTNYDFEVSDAITGMEISETVFDASSAYGCLVNRSAVCSGYSAAFQLIMQRLGIPCGRVTGAKTEGESHEWNYVVLDGDYYYVDVTWDDPQSTEVFTKLRSYEFFCITSAELQKTHTIDEDQFVPECTAVKYDYYIYHNQYFKTYDFDGFREAVKASNDSGVSVKFSTEEELQRAVNDLFTLQRIFFILNQRHVSYSIGVSGLVLSVPFE